MFGVTTPEMVAATNKLGCLGALPLSDMPTELALKEIEETATLTNLPFIVNLFTHSIPPIDEELQKQYECTKAYLIQLANQLDFNINIPTLEEIKPISYHDLIEVVLYKKSNYLSFTFGNLDAESIDKLKANGTILIGTCTTISEAIELDTAGIDIICVQGIEAGGHRGSFDNLKIPSIGGLSLLSQLNDCIQKPLIYAGGIYNGATLHAAKIMGAKGFQVGSILTCSDESALQKFEKERLKNVTENEIILTKSFSGRTARGIENEFIKMTENSPYILPYPYQNKLTASLRKAAKQHQNTEFTNLWIGQSHRNLKEDSTENILKNLIHSAELI